jgi:multiple sugar transport system ATP-binding protein
MAKVELRGLRRRYPGAETAALDALDLDVESGELLVLVGPSGCGKSTALRLLAGLDTPDAGSIRIDGNDVSRTPPQDRDVAMVFQGYALYPHLTARENIGFPLKMRGVRDPERARRVDEVAALLGLSRLLGRRPGELSGGERQRVAMGRAIVRKPKVFLFDEPLSNLDAALRAELRVELSALVRRLGTTSLYVTHDQIEAMTMGSRIAVLRGGKLQQIGPPRSIYEDPANDFVAGFLGSPPMNWIALDRDEATPRDAEAALPQGYRDGVQRDMLRGAGTTFPAPAGIKLPPSVKAGVRPEHIHFDASPARSVALGAEVVSVEPLGAETHVLLDASGTRIRVKTAGFAAPALGESVRVHLDPHSLLWFDAESGARLRSA